MVKISRCGMILIMLLYVVVWETASDTSGAENTVGDQSLTRTTVGNDLSGIHSEITLKDIQTAWEVWQDELGPKANLIPQHLFYTDLQALIADFNEGRLDMVDTTSINYLRMKPAIGHNINPEIYGVLRDGKKTHRYFLLVRADSHFSQFKDLQDMTLLMKKHDATGRFYLNALLKRNELILANSFFLEIHEVESYSRAVLGVFFEQAQACITTEAVFRIMKELNPQVGKHLKVLHVSPEIMNSVFFFHKAYNQRAQEELVKEALNLDKTDYGRQILMLYKIDRILQIDEAELAPLYDLLEDDDFFRPED